MTKINYFKPMNYIKAPYAVQQLVNIIEELANTDKPSINYCKEKNEYKIISSKQSSDNSVLTYATLSKNNETDNYKINIAREIKIITSEKVNKIEESKAESIVNNLNLNYNNKYYILDGSDENDKEYLAVVMEMKSIIQVKNLNEGLDNYIDTIDEIKSFFNETKGILYSLKDNYEINIE